MLGEVSVMFVYVPVLFSMSVGTGNVTSCIHRVTYVIKLTKYNDSV